VASAPRGLGRGLAAMLDPASSDAPYVRIPVDRIVPNPHQPRTALDQEALAELTRSIRRDGIIQPLLVRDRGDGVYELIAGERRWRAATAAGLRDVPAIVRSADERESLVLALVENVIREDLNAIEVARGYAALSDEHGLGVLEIAERVGRSRAAVSNTLRLLELPDDVIGLIESGTLSEGHGRAILQQPDHGDRRRLARRVAAAGLSVRETEQLARRQRTRQASGEGPAWFDDVQEAELLDAAARALGVTVRVRGRRGGVQIELQVTSDAELARLQRRLDEVAELVETHIVR
jgi:ParB family transcriptional regulator, chromosome partitioning protein